MRKLYPLLLVMIGLLATSCLNIKSVNTFSTSTIASLQPTLPVTFEGVYKQRTIDDSLNRHPYKRIPVVGLNFAEQVRRDSLRSYQLADSLTRSGTLLLVNYFKAIAALSDQSNSFKPVQLKSPSFDAFLQQSAVKLTAEETIALNRVLSVVFAATTGQYRRRELGSLLETSYSDVRRVMSVLIFAHERLAEVVSISREQQYNHYKNGLIQDNSLTYIQKRDLAKQWLQTSAATEQSRQAILTHIKTLKTIRTGFNELYSNRNQLKSNELLTAVKSYAASLQQLRADLEQLNPVYGRLVP